MPQGDDCANKNDDLEALSQVQALINFQQGRDYLTLAAPAFFAAPSTPVPGSPYDGSGTD
jgi:hypothetical protein